MLLYLLHSLLPPPSSLSGVGDGDELLESILLLLLLVLELGHQLRVLHAENGLANGRQHPELAGRMRLKSAATTSGDEPLHHAVDGRVAKGENLSSGGEDDYGDLGTSQDGELAGLLGEAGATLGEADLSGVDVLYLLDLDLLPPHACSPRHCCFVSVESEKFYPFDEWCMVM